MTDREALAESIRRDILAIGSIYPSVGQAFYEEVLDRLSMRIAGRVEPLLKALEACLPDLEHYVSTHGPGPDRRLDAARAALAKAKGKTQ